MDSETRKAQLFEEIQDVLHPGYRPVEPWKPTQTVAELEVLLAQAKAMRRGESE